ncbi:sulfotransferase domain-containing protein [Longibacter salinarum]|nr:sulfotransferase domain-containing protein [Longibacter salinarum]
MNYILREEPLAALLRYPEWLVDAAIGATLNPNDAIVISGFWRSGTTWLLQSVANSLGAKSLFEPLLPHIGSYEQAFQKRYPASTFSKRVKPDGVMPYCANILDEFPGLRLHLENMLVGALPSHFVRMVRESKKRGEETDSRMARLNYRIQEALCRQVVVKLVRGALILPLIVDEFNPSILHVRRDPRAVVASYKRQAWTDWMEDSALHDLLLSPNDGRRDIFQRWGDEINKIDEMGYAARVAGYWALTEWYVDQHKEESDIALVSYERLCLEGADYLNDVFSHMNTGVQIESGTLSRESHTSNRSSNEKAKDRIWGWKSEMSPTEIRNVEAAVGMVGMSDSLIDRS